MNRIDKILIDFRAKPGTGIFRYATRLLNQKDFICEPYRDSFADYENSGRISPFAAIQRFLYECFILPFRLRKRKIRLFHCTKNFGLPLFSCAGSYSFAFVGLCAKPFNPDILLLEYLPFLCGCRSDCLYFSIYGK